MCVGKVFYKSSFLRVTKIRLLRDICPHNGLISFSYFCGWVSNDLETIYILCIWLGLGTGTGMVILCCAARTFISADFIFGFRATPTAALNKYEINTKCVVGCLRIFALPLFPPYIYKYIFIFFCWLKLFLLATPQRADFCPLPMACLSFAFPIPRPRIPNTESWLLDPESWVLGPTPIANSIPFPFISACLCCVVSFALNYFPPVSLASHNFPHFGFLLTSDPVRLGFHICRFFRACWGDVLNICQMKSRWQRWQVGVGPTPAQEARHVSDISEVIQKLKVKCKW